MFRRKVQRVIESRLASSIQIGECGDKVINTVRKILLKIHPIVEIDDERLVVGIAFRGERQRGPVHPFALVVHASTVVYDETDAQRDIFVFEQRNFL